MVATMTTAWNFALTGQLRSGMGVVLSAINGRRDEAVCHADLFHASNDVRKAAHARSFGPLAPAAERIPPEWFVDGLTSPWQYIDRVVFAQDGGRKAVGFQIGYDAVSRLELYDLFETKGREGGFSLVQVSRNPVACFVSLKQAQQTGVWTRTGVKRVASAMPPPVRVNAEELVRFCREHAAVESKIRATCHDRLQVSYSELVFDFQAAMRRVFDHIELPQTPHFARPGRMRLRNRPVLERISNLTELRIDLPSDVRELLKAEDLI